MSETLTGDALLIAESLRANEYQLRCALGRAGLYEGALDVYAHPDRYATGTRDLKPRRYYEKALAGAVRDAEFHRGRIERLRAALQAEEREGERS